MQGTHQQLQTQLWNKLQSVYDRYTDKAAGQIPTSKVQQIVYEALGQQTQQQIDYVIKNMFRLDSDESGSVSFLEFANFLFKRHCGQMSLQKMHLKGAMTHGAQRKMTKAQFNTLMNNAYKFLGVQAPNAITDVIFDQTDKDKDSLITYVEYFQIIDNYICRKVIPKPVPQPPVDKGVQRFSKLRILIWTSLRKLYEAYVSGRHLNSTDNQLRGLILAIYRQLSSNDLAFLLSQIFKLDWKTIQFYPFACHFLYLIGALGVSNFKLNHPSSKKTLTKFQFVLLFKNSYSFLRISKLSNEFLWLHFAKIDKNNDGLITFEQYLDWIKRFIAVVQYFGDQFYVAQDDQSSKFQMYQVDPPVKVQPKKIVKKFNFSDLSLAYLVRKTCFTLLEKYDVNKDKLFDQNQIHGALIELLKQNQYQLAYVTKNVFRYDRDGDKNVTYEQLTNFCVQQHFGQMAIQRLHRKEYYSKGRQRIMNQPQFAKTLCYALSFLSIQPSQQILKLLFSQIDLDHDGWISYEVYFMFLRYYFGSLSQASQNDHCKPDEKPLSKDEEFLISLKDLSAFDRFVRILIDQLKPLCLAYDYNKNLVFQVDQIQAILINIFKLSANQVSLVISQYFKFSSRKQKFVTFQEMIAIILEIYFIEILFRRKYKTEKFQNWNNKLISLEQFIILIWQACHFIRVRPPKDDLKVIFQTLDTNKDGFITFKQYIDFIVKYLGIGIVKQEQKTNVKPVPDNNISEEQRNFVQALWGELKKYFDQYDKGSKNFLNQQELKAFSIEILRETSKRQLDYIFWNLFRVDPNLNKEVQFVEFAPFILSHAAQISLQRFHREQQNGKNTLSEQELFIVLKNAYNFLSTMPKSRNVVEIIFKRISSNGSVSYGSFLSWVMNALSRKFK